MKVKSGKSRIAHRNAKIVECSSLIYFFLLPFLSAPRSEKREVPAENPPPKNSFVCVFVCLGRMLAAYQNFYHFFLLSLIIGQISCFVFWYVILEASSLPNQMFLFPVSYSY